MDPPIYWSIDPSIYWSIDLQIHWSTDLLIHRSIDPSIYRSIDLLIHWSIDLLIHRSIDPSIYRSIDPSIYWSIDPLIHRSTDPLIHRFNDLSIWISTDFLKWFVSLWSVTSVVRFLHVSCNDLLFCAKNPGALPCHCPRVSPGDQPLTKKASGPGIEIGNCAIFVIKYAYNKGPWFKIIYLYFFFLFTIALFWQLINFS